MRNAECENLSGPIDAVHAGDTLVMLTHVCIHERRYTQDRYTVETPYLHIELQFSKMENVNTIRAAIQRKTALAP